MGIAEEELAGIEDPRGGFMLVVPTREMGRFPPALYRSHCRELLRRLMLGVKPGRAMAQATDAELVLAFLNMSQKAPLKHDYSKVYEACFTWVFPEDALRLEIEEDLNDYQEMEVLPESRHVLRDRSREAWRPNP